MNGGQILPLAGNWLWTSSSYFDYHHFLRSLENPGRAQEQYLKKLLRANAGTSYGRDHHFQQISSISDFQRKVPLTQYEDYLPYLERISQGESTVLTEDPVILFQPTSGTTSPSKMIPYTRTLKAEYQRSISAWTYHLYRRIPALMQGRAYWSISPAVNRKKLYGCIPVGFDNDAEYLSKIGRLLFNLVSVGQNELAADISTHDFWDQTSINLLAAQHLTLISVWSPIFLLTLVKHFAENWGKILETLEKSDLPGAGARARGCQRTIQSQGLDLGSIWPDLKLISCWTHGASETCIPEIGRYFPQVEIQGKGLVSTEAFVSLPLRTDKDPVVSIDSHFFEFREAGTGKICLASELREGVIYSVIVTTGGGLYRYEMNDLVKVTGYIAGTPTLRFISKEMVSDLAGEKLNIDHVQHSLNRALAECALEPAFRLLAPVRSPDKTISYALFLCSPGASREQLILTRNRLETYLRDNFHYAYCRNLGQLGNLKLFQIDPAPVPPEAIYLQEISRRGQKLGDIKSAVVDRETGWEDRFQGHFLETGNS